VAYSRIVICRVPSFPFFPSYCSPLPLSYPHTHSCSSLLDAQVLRQSPFDACLQILSGSKSNFDERYNAFFIDYSLLPLVRHANTHIQRNCTQTDRHTYRETAHRQIDTQTDRHTDGSTHRRIDTQTDRHTDR
jgi:hypothetical protein